MCMEVDKTDYMYKTMFNDSNLNRFWRCDSRIIRLGMRFQYYPSFDGSCENIFLAFFYLPSFPSFFMSSDFLTFHHFLLFPLLLSSSCFLLCISVAGKQPFFHSTFLSCCRSLFLCFSPVCFYFFFPSLFLCYSPSSFYPVFSSNIFPQ